MAFSGSLVFAFPIFVLIWSENSKEHYLKRTVIFCILYLVVMNVISAVIYIVLALGNVTQCGMMILGIIISEN